ncbi:hypothetical protein HanHA300_Chr14g0508441 [Helianthus annuus]|nr:hypothetical protein HanHA300_Chr14g0508441 [Helianthus annuus]KAJ0484173.1 hypothetical protein HanHA89_Chr14g0541171 [Helianthus annuus]KAJ0658478.1 hypothetical protein HanOQP8_Chr14g0508681 [Helianthus annuus]
MVSFVMDAKTERRNVGEISINRNYPEVFLKRLTWIFSARRIEFRIDLTHGAAPDCTIFL